MEEVEEQREDGWDGRSGVRGKGGDRTANAIYHLLILERHLPCGHAGVLSKVRPWRVDDCDVVFFIA